MRDSIQNVSFIDERSLFGRKNIDVSGCTFDVGESPLKECLDITVSGSSFRYKYPFWYCKGIKVVDCTVEQGGRAGIWYTDDAEFDGCRILAPKNFRRCRNLSLKNVELTDAQETLWQCSKVSLENVKAKGDYFAMNSSDMTIDNLELDGNYSFDGGKNLKITNSRLISKDAFWNTENVTVYDSFISGEYIGWNAKNLTFVNCTIESLQGLCYIENLTLKNCKTPNTNLAFEYCSNIDATIIGPIESIINPTSGKITAGSIGELILDPSKTDISKTEIECDDIKKRSSSSEIFIIKRN